MLAHLRSVASMIFRRSSWEQDLSDEVLFHIEQRAEHLASTGLARQEALRRARLEFGAVEGYKEGCREARGARWIDELSRNIVYAMRSIRKNPGFTAVAVLSLALGIGANLAVFSVLHRLVLTKLPVRDPEHLYQVLVVSNDRTQYRIPFPKFEVMRDNLDVFKPLFGWGGFPREVAVGDWKERVQVVGVTGNYFEALGLRPALGRLLTSADEQGRASQIAVVSYRLWQTVFAGDPGIIGRSLTVEDAAFVIAGVAPPEFGGTEPGAPPAVYLPLHGYERITPNALKGPGLLWFHVMGRIPADAPLPAVRAMLRERWAQLDEPNRRRFARNTADAIALEDGTHGYSDARIEFSGAVLVLMGLVATVFLIACANIATLLFVRGAGRTREMSIRIALGAGRAQLIRQWMTECLLVAGLGGAAGLAAAYWITDLLLYFVAEADRPWLRFQAGPTVVLVSLALTFAAGLLCGLLPAIRATHVGCEPALRAQAGAATERRGRLAQWVLAGQLAASLVLVVGGALFARTLWNLNAASAGFDRRAVVYAIPNLNTAVPRDRRPAVMMDVLDRVTRSPLVAAASMGSPPILWGRSSFGYVAGVRNYTLQPDEDNAAYTNGAYRGYFDVLRIPLIAGRDFEERDRSAPNEQPEKMIVNESFARHYFGNRNPVGERVAWTYLTGPKEIIGVVKDIKNKSLRDGRKDEVYFPIGLDSWSAVIARAKPGIAPSSLEAEIRSAFAAVAKQVSVEIAPLEDAVQRSLGRDRLVAQLSAAFGALGILLASIGLYAAIAHTVTNRTREIGIRIAIGATARDVIWMVLKQSLLVTAIGVLIGLPMAIAGSRLVSSLLYEVSPSDPPTLAVSTAVLALTGLVAGWWPARRAARLDPSRTLRFE